MKRYTDAEIAAANDVDLPELLSSLGYQVRRVGQYFTTEEMDSLRIKNRRTWYRYSEAVGGDAIAFLRHFQGMTFHEAVSYLLVFNSYPVTSSIPAPIQRSRPPPERGRPIFILSTPHSDNRRVITYLRARGIAQAVINGFIEAGLLYEEAEHHNCVFVGRDKAGKPVFAARRSTRTSFKGDVADSDKSVAFRVNYDSALDSVHVFESPVDMMSWFVLYGTAFRLSLTV